MAKRSRGPRPEPGTAYPPKVPMLAAAGAFAALAVLAVASAIVSGQLIALFNAVVPAVVAVLFTMIALKQSIKVDRRGVTVQGFGNAGRTIRWADVKRLELTDASRWRMGPRLVVKNERALPLPPQWRMPDKTRLSEAVLGWSRWSRIEVVGERVTGRRWPMFALLLAGALAALIVALVPTVV